MSEQSTKQLLIDLDEARAYLERLTLEEAESGVGEFYLYEIVALKRELRKRNIIFYNFKANATR